MCREVPCMVNAALSLAFQICNPRCFGRFVERSLCVRILQGACLESNTLLNVAMLEKIVAEWLTTLRGVVILESRRRRLSTTPYEICPEAASCASIFVAHLLCASKTFAMQSPKISRVLFEALSEILRRIELPADHACDGSPLFRALETTRLELLHQSTGGCGRSRPEGVARGDSDRAQRDSS